MNPPSNDREPPAGDNDPQRSPITRALFAYVKVPIVAGTEDRFHQREYALDRALRDRDIGAVVGWGDSLGPAQSDGSRPVAFLRIDIDVKDLAAVRALLRDTLPILGVAPGTEIHYTLEQRNLQDIYLRSGWLLEQPA